MSMMSGMSGTMAILAIGETREICQKLITRIGRVNTIAARHIARDSLIPNHFGTKENNRIKKSPKNKSPRTARNER